MAKRRTAKVRKSARIVALVLGLFTLWFPVTWLFFWSVHPCGILNYRMAERNRMYADYIYLWEARLLWDTKPSKGPIDTIAEWEQLAYKLSPAVCLWRAITWRWNPERDQTFQRWKRLADGD